VIYPLRLGYNYITPATKNNAEAISKIAKHFHMTIDQLVNFEGDMPQEITIEDKNTVEQMQLIQQLDEEDKNTVFKIIDKMLTTKKFKDFFNKNVATL